MKLKNTFYRLYDLSYNNKTIFLALVATIVLLQIDISLVNVNRFTTSQSLSGWRTYIFLVLAFASTVLQFFILKFVKIKSKEVRNKKELHLDITYTVSRIIQYLIIGILALAIVQMALSSRYNVYILFAIVGISYLLGTVLMSMLAKRFFSWFRSNRSFVVLLYGLSSAIIAINLSFSLVYIYSVLPIHLEEIRPHTSFLTPFHPAGSIISIFNNGYIITSVISFVITWIATALLLRHYYSQRLGRIKYWAIIGLPLAFFLVQFQPLFLNLFYQPLQSSPVLSSILYTLIFTFSKPIGGIVFGVAFWTVAKSLRRGTSIRDYMIISAFGLILLFVSNQAIVLVTAPYPPFGLVTVSFIGLSSYLILVGIYSSAISVSEDVVIRRTIRKLVTKESELLDSIGSSHMEQELERRVLKITKKASDRMEEQTGVEPSVTEDSMKEYLYEVLEEVKRTKSTND
jgi:hypothetical protein